MDGEFFYKFSNGSIYQGEIRQGKMHGQGLMKYVNGLNGYNIYEGEFADDKKNGFGTMTYAKGDVYRGEWKGDSFVSNGRSPSISHSNSRRSSLASIGHIVSQKLVDVDQSDGSRSLCISRRSSRNNLASIGHMVSQKLTDQSDGSRSPCISRRSSRNTLDSGVYDSIDLAISRRNSLTPSQCSTPTHDFDHDMDKHSRHIHAHSPNQDIMTVDSIAEVILTISPLQSLTNFSSDTRYSQGAAINRSNMKGLLDSLDSKLSNCHSTAGNPTTTLTTTLKLF